MILTGEYTQAGAVLAARIQAGTAPLALTRAAAGSGVTPQGAEHMADEKQELSLQPAGLSGATLTVPVQLISLSADQAYTLREIGLFARTPEGDELLYKLYRFDQPVGISPLSELNATFYLNDTVAPGTQPTVEVTAQGLLSQRDVPGIIEAVMARGLLTQSDVPDIVQEVMSRGLLTTADGESLITQAVARTIDTEAVWIAAATTINCTTGNLVATLNALPKLISNDITINVTTDIDISGTQVELGGFFGPGTLTIKGVTQFHLSTLRIQGVRIARLILDNINVGGKSQMVLPTKGVAGINYSKLWIKSCTALVDVRNVSVTYAGNSSAYGGIVVENAPAVLTAIVIKAVPNGIVAHNMARVIVRSFASGSQGLDYAFRVFNGSMLTWPGTAATLSTQTGCSSYHCASGATVLFGGGTLNVASGFTNTEY